MSDNPLIKPGTSYEGLDSGFVYFFIHRNEQPTGDTAVIRVRVYHAFRSLADFITDNEKSLAERMTRWYMPTWIAHFILRRIIQTLHSYWPDQV